MRILQIIDSLEIGGAEKMAINYANSLSELIEFSGLVATRKEGSLKNQLNDSVHYLFLNRKSTFDFNAVFRLKNYCKEHKINYLHAHGSSFFTALLVKLLVFRLKIIWHDHNGLRQSISKPKLIALKIASLFFNGVITVNFQLKEWALKELFCNNTIYLANFTTQEIVKKAETKLKGIDGKKIVCLANLRFPKNHLLLIEVAKKLTISHPEWSFHFIGKDSNDDYSNELKFQIEKYNLKNSVYLYGSKEDTENIISQACIAVLSSESEGLPVALLEYGLNKKAVVSTNVGEIPMIIKNNENGFLVSNYDHNAFYQALVLLIDNDDLRMRFGVNLFETIQQNHSQKAVINFYSDWIKKI